MAIRIAGGEGTWEFAHVSVPCLPCPPPLPAPVTHSTLSTLCTTAPFPVVLWQCTQLRLPCSPSGDLQSARLLGLLLMFQTVLFALQIFEKDLQPPFCNGVWHLLVYWHQSVSVTPVVIRSV